MGDKGDRKETEEGIAPGLEEFEAQLSEAGGIAKPEPPDPESMLETPPKAESEGDAGDDKPTLELAEEPTQTLEDGEAPPVTDDAPTKSVSEATFKVPKDDFYGAFAGREMTGKQLEEAGLLEKILTGAHQVSHFQRLHEDSKAKLLAMEERLSKIEKPPEPEKQMTPEQFVETIKRDFTPVVDDMVKNGLIEDDFAVAYPKVAQLQEFRVKTFIDTMTQIHERLAAVEENVTPWKENEASNQAVNNVSQIVSKLVTEDEQLMGGLKEPDTQKEFFAFLADKERSGVRFTPYDATAQDIRGAWIAYLLDKGSEIPTRKKEVAPQGQRGMTGTGGKVRGRGAQPAGENLDDVAKMEREFMASLESRFD